MNVHTTLLPLARLIGALLPLALLLVGSAVSAAEPAPVAPRAPAREAIDQAIQGGVRWLLGEQRPDGAFGGAGEDALGPTALAVYALLHAGLMEDGASPEDRRLARSLAWIDRRGPGRGNAPDRDPGTYATSLTLLALRSRGRAQDAPRLQRLADLLVRTQAHNGQWGYAGEPGDTGRSGPRVGDNSNTQFALLGLGAAAGEGVLVPEACWARARTWWESSASQRGGFGYASGGSLASAPTGSMTAAAICCLAVLAAQAAVDPAIQARQARVLSRALDWLGEVFSVTRNAGPAQGAAGERQKNAGRGWLHYYLWTLERACVLAGVERLAARDWFAEGTAQLVATQTRDGSWVGEAPLYATCFALLFLTRAADPPRAFTPPATSRGPVTAPGGPAREPQPPAPPEVVGPADPRADPPLTPEDLVRRALAEGTASLERLAAALNDPQPAVRRRSLEALTALLPAEPLLGVESHPLARGRLSLWLRRERRFLQVQGGRFVVVP